MKETDLGLWTVVLAVLAGAIRVGTPFLFVSLGECLTEKSGRINLGLEGTLVLGAMVGYAGSYLSGSPWLGVLAAGVVGSVFGLLHGWICKFPRVNDVAIGIAMMLLGMGLAFYFGKPFIQPSAPCCPRSRSASGRTCRRSAPRSASTRCSWWAWSSPSPCGGRLPTPASAS
jgi:general nucleoside transport system permease protein